MSKHGNFSHNNFLRNSGLSKIIEEALPIDSLLHASNEKNMVNHKRQLRH